MDNSKLQHLWSEQQSATFPLSCRDIKVNGTTLLQLDVTVGRILTKSLQRDGIPRPLSEDDSSELLSLRPTLENAIPLLENHQDGLQYFHRLKEILFYILPPST